MKIFDQYLPKSMTCMKRQIKKRYNQLTPPPQKSISFFKIAIHSMQGGTANIRHGVTRKRSTKRLKHTENLL